MKETKRLILRNFKLEDSEDVYEYSKDEETVKYLTWENHKSIEQTKDVLTKFFVNNENNYALVVKETNKCIGSIDLRIDKENDKLSFGYVLNKAYWNKGYMSEALNWALEYAFLDLNLNRVEATYYVGNIGSGKVMEKCGMKQEGLALKEVKVKGRYFDVVHMAILKENYLKDRN